MLKNCVVTGFCLDCGDEPTEIKPAELHELTAKLTEENDYSKISGKILMQVLVDSTGHSCVLSHTDKSNSKITKNIVDAVNGFTGWLPAKTEGKTEGMTSVNLLADINNGILSLQIQRVNQKAFMESFDHPNNPEIFNKNYQYKNEHLSEYAFTIWNSKNSNLPNNFNNDIIIDTNNIVWLTVDDGLVKFNGNSFTDAGQNITPKNKFFGYTAIAVDNYNTKWVRGKDGIYTYDNSKWTLLTPEVIGVKGAYKIINNEKTGEIFLCGDEGLAINKNGTWSLINKVNTKALPSNRVNFAKRDSKRRLWIGTFSGSVLIDENSDAIDFNKTNTVLKNKCITSMDEDENGNIYFGLFEYDRKDKKSVNNDEGIAIYNKKGELSQYKTSNSGMPYNHVTKVLYDRIEKVLWIATDRAGLVRYDLNDGWENYHNQNSGIPTSYIADMAFDRNGILYLATRQGLVRVTHK